MFIERVSALYINHNRYFNIVINLFIPYFITCTKKGNMLEIVLKIEWIYISVRCSNTTHSVCVDLKL